MVLRDWHLLSTKWVQEEPTWLQICISTKKKACHDREPWRGDHAKEAHVGKRVWNDKPWIDAYLFGDWGLLEVH